MVKKSPISEKSELWNESIRYFPLTQAVTVSLTASISDCVEKMQDHMRGCVFIVDKNNFPCGFVTERDILRDYVCIDTPGDTPITKIMRADPMQLSPNATMAEALNCFSKNQYRHIPVIDEGKKVLGYLTFKTIVDFLAEHFPAEILNQAPDMQNISTETAGG